MNIGYYNNFKGIMYMILNALSASILFGLVKVLSKEVSSNQIVFFYKFFSLIIILPWILKDGFKELHTKKFTTYLLACLFGTAATLSLMHGIKYLPLANVTALGYMEKILLIIIGITYFKEKINKTIIASVLFSVIGAIIVIYPKIIDSNNVIEFNTYYYFIFASIILWVIYRLIIKNLTKTESTKTQSFYIIFLSSLISMPVAFIEWSSNSLIPIEINFSHMFLLALTAICYFILSISSFRAYRSGDLVIIMPFSYSKIIFSAIIGAVLFNQYPSSTNYIGYIIISMSSLCLIYQSRGNRKLI